MKSSPEQPTFLQHYIDYLSSDAGLIATFILFTILLLAWTRRQQRAEEAPLTIPGCVRFGLYNRSNLDAQPESSQAGTLPEDQEPRVQALFTYPIKSCRGVELSGSEVTGYGLRYDRLFSFAQLVKKTDDKKGDLGEKESATHRWRFITQRERPQMALITTELWIPDPRLRSNVQESRSASESKQPVRDSAGDWTANGGCLVLRFPHKKTLFGINLPTETITIKLPLAPTPQRARPKGYMLEPFSIWKDTPLAWNMTPEINPQAFSKLQNFLGISNPLSLFRVDDGISNENLRAITRSLPKKSHPNEKYSVGFGDAFPLSLLSLSSINSLEASLPTTITLKSHLDPRRFRANIYISGTIPFAEDSWKRIHLGLSQGSGEDEDEDDTVIERGEYHIACRTARCTLPNVDPATGVRDKLQEPFETLKRTRVVDEGAKPHSSLGVSVLPLFGGDGGGGRGRGKGMGKMGVVRVGDLVGVLEVGVHVYEKMFK